MFNKVVSILLLFLLSFTVVCKIGVTISWSINQNQIAATQCEKRNIKNNCCQGKCQLEKQLKKVDQPSNPIQEKMKWKEFDSFVGNSYFQIESHITQGIDLTPKGWISSRYSLTIILDRLKPPVALV